MLYFNVPSLIKKIVHYAASAIILCFQRLEEIVYVISQGGKKIATTKTKGNQENSSIFFH